MSLSQSDFDILKGYIDETNASTEVKCQPFLMQATALLVKEPSASDFSIDNIYQERELPSISGRSDYYVACTLNDGTRSNKKVVYIWEVKKPQCCLFETDTKQRLIPSNELISAENQLLYYKSELAGSDTFRRRLNIPSHESVKFGGIIIGKKQNKVNNREKLSPDKLDQLFDEALELRETHFYKHNGISIYLWDTILEFLNPNKTKLIQQNKSGAMSTPPS